MSVTSFELLRQWVKVAFAIMLGISFIVVFDSVFLAIMTWTFLFFIPIRSREMERSFSTAIFTLGMGILLYLAFYQSPTLGLGLELDLTNSMLGEGWGEIAIWALFITLLFKILFSFASPRKAEEPRTMLWLVDVAIYFLIVGLLVVLQPWGWDTSAIIFIGIFVLAYISGSAGDQESRQTIGIVMILISFVIFSMGIGTQLVGAGLFGDWFPSVYQGISTVMGPIGEAFQSFSEMFGNAIFLITNPQGYAQSIMNGTFQQDPDTGLRGAFGVELSQMSTSPIYIGQPYSSIVKVWNRGSFTGENVKVSIKLGEKSPGDAKYLVLYEEATIQDLGYHTREKDGVTCDTKSCSQWVDNKQDNELVKVDQRQLFFESTEEGITCPAVIEYNLVEQFIPFEAVVEYDYEIDSFLDIEFTSQEEWDRLVAEGKFITQTKKPASLKNAPVRLNIDTLEQPIREGNTPHIGLYLISAKDNGEVSDASITMELPGGLRVSGCSPKPTSPTTFPAGGDSGTTFIWDNKDFSGGYLIFCTLESVVFGSEDGPSKTFIVTASADYRFEERKDFFPTKIEFGGTVCCEEGEDDCLGSQDCVDNVCTAGSGTSALEELEAKIAELEAKQDIIDLTLTELIELGRVWLEARLEELEGLVMAVELVIDKYSGSSDPVVIEAVNQLTESIDFIKTETIPRYREAIENLPD